MNGHQLLHPWGQSSCSLVQLKRASQNLQRYVRVRDAAAGIGVRLLAPEHSEQNKLVKKPIRQGVVRQDELKKKYVPFRPEFFSSEPVQLAGSWNDWSDNVVLPIDPQTGEAGTVLELDARQQDEITYKYNVCGKWHMCTSDESASDSQGCVNNTTAGRKLVRFTFPAVFAGPRAGVEQEVHLIGSFTGWQVVIPMALGSDGSYHCNVALPPGHHTFRFLLSGQPQSPAHYAVLKHLPLETLPTGVQANSLRVPAQPSFKMLYHTDFDEAHICYRFRGYQDDAQCVRMHHQPGCSGLMVATLPAPADAVLEFSVQGMHHDASTTLTTQEEDSATGSRSGPASSFALQRDPPGARMYTAARPGVWRLDGGVVRMDEASQLPPIMLCTDLDGTLLEDGDPSSEYVQKNDSMTRQAAQYFGQHLAPAGGVLVFNTGRSIGMVEGLLTSKAGIMPWPAAIITAVGTKVFLQDVATRKWVPDPAYSHLLDDGWNLAEVRRLAQHLMGRFNGQASCIDDGSEHPHRISLSIRSDILAEFIKRWAAGLQKAGVEAQFVTSIGGEWRYVDCIAKNAGKGRAMVYLASKFGVQLEDVVAAGDSGNDLLMLGKMPEGNHPAIVMSNSHPEVWDWLASLTPEERAWVYTPKAACAGGIIEGLKAIIVDKLAAQHEKQRKAALQRPVSPAVPPKALMG